MNLIRSVVIFAILTICVGCSPGIRFRPGEIPTPTSTAPEYLQAGHQLHQQVLNEMPILREPAAIRRVSRVLTKLLRVTPSMGHWTVTLIDDPRFNAMTAPGNYIYVFKGMLDQTRNDDEVAAVLAHEIAHRLAQHERKTSEQQWGEALAMLATVAAGVAVASTQGSTPQDVQDIMNATGTIGAGFTTLRYGKDQEREADQIGMFLLADAGINPSAAADVWAGRIAAEGAGVDDFFSTHPLHEDRYAMAVSLLPIAHTRYESARKRGSTVKKTKTPPPLSPTVQVQISKAHEAIANQDLQTASVIAQSLTSKAPSSPEVQNLLGYVRSLQGDTNKAFKAFRKGLSLDPENSVLLYNMGCMHARQGDREKALWYLEKAFSRNQSLIDGARDDSDLASLQDDARFIALLEKQYVALPPTNVGGNTFSVN